MRDIGLGWIFLLMLVWAEESLQYSCSDTRNCSCACISPDEYELECPRDQVNPMFRVKVHAGHFAEVRCRRMSSWSDFGLNLTAEVEEVQAFSIEQCPLPDSNLLEITQRIGVRPLDRLRFVSFKTLGSILERRYLTGFSNLNKLQLSDNGLAELPADLLSDLPELMLLDLRENSVVLPVQFFHSVPKLQFLELGRNKLTRIDPLLFRSLGQLDLLHLWGNKLTNLDEHTFSNLRALSALDISRNELATLPQGIFNPLLNLSRLQLSRNNFSTIPDNLLSKNVKFTSLRLSDNRGTLRTLPNGFLRNLPKLENISLMNNKLEVLPEDILWGSPSITHLDFSGNSLSSLPKTIFNESINLRTLDLSSNRLTNLPFGIFEVLNKLEILNLQRNNLAFISRHFFVGLDNLKELNLEYSGMKSIASHSFELLHKMQIARLSHNQLTFEDDSVGPPFLGCSNLRELYLAHNNISNLRWVSNILPTLRTLDLKHNQIPYIYDEDFEYFREDIVVDVTYNKITEVELFLEQMATSIYYDHPKDVKILIEGNPIVCDCSFHVPLQYIESNVHPSTSRKFRIIPGNSMCHGPESKRQIRVSELNPRTLCHFGNCPEKCECWFAPYDNTILANCSYRSLTISTAPERYIACSECRVEVDLTGNFLTEVPFINQSRGHITKLLLSHNNISSVSLDRLPPTLEVLELHKNNLTKLDITVPEFFGNLTSLKKFTLDGNP